MNLLINKYISSLSIRHDGVFRSNDPAAFEHHPRRLAVLHDDLLDVFLELHATAEFLQAPAELVDHRRGATHGRAQ